MIVGSFGFQRSGKTAMAVMLSRFLAEKGFDLYGNIDAVGFNRIQRISEIPVDYRPKVVLFDEAYYFLDSRNFKDNTDYSLFLNTLGKQKILLIVTAIAPDQIEKRIRRQLSFMILAKGSKNDMQYMFVDVLRQKVSAIYTLTKNKELFDYLDYNSYLVVPNYVECDIKRFVEKNV